MSSSEHIVKNEKDNKTLIISFSGYAKQFGGIQPFEFLNFLNKYYPNTDKIFYIDHSASCYHKGINGISTDINTTVEYIKTKIKGYTKVLFMGVSGGGYAAILFGSLLNVSAVLAFMPPTILCGNDKEKKYRNIAKYINSTTWYNIYADLSIKDTSNPHHHRHCENIKENQNVFITNKKTLVLKDLRDSGELKYIISSMICQN